MSAKFDALAAKVGSTRLAGYITTHNPVIRARAEKTKARKRARDVIKSAGRNNY